MRKVNLFIIFLLLTSPCLADSSMTLREAPTEFTEEDGSPSTFPYKLKFNNGTLTDNGDETTSHDIDGYGSAVYLKLDASNDPVTGNLQIGNAATDIHGINTAPVAGVALTITTAGNRTLDLFDGTDRIQFHQAGGTMQSLLNAAGDTVDLIDSTWGIKFVLGDGSTLKSAQFESDEGTVEIGNGTHAIQSGGSILSTGDLYIDSDTAVIGFGLASPATPDATIGFDGDSFNIIANAVTSSNPLEFTAGSYEFKVPADTDIVLNFTGTTNQSKFSYFEDEDSFVIGDDTGAELQFNYPFHVSVASGGKGIQIGEQDQGDAGDHPSFLSMSHKFTADTGGMFRGIHNEYQWQAQNSSNIINVIHTTKFTGSTTYTQADVRGVGIQLESDNDNFTLNEYKALELFKPTNWQGTAGWHGTIGTYQGIFINNMDVATQNNSIYTVGGDGKMFFGGLSDGASTGAGLVTIRDSSLAQLSLEYSDGKEWHFRAASGGALLVKNDGTTAFRIEETNYVRLPIDNQHLQIGATTTDFELYSDGTDARIDATGDLRIDSNAIDLFVADVATTGTDGNSLYLRRNVGAEDSYYRFYIDQYGNAKWFFYPYTSGRSFAIDAPTTGAKLTLNQGAAGDIEIFGLANSGENPSFFQGGYITAAGDEVLIEWQVEDTNDYFVLDRENTNIVGFKVNMPLVVTGTIQMDAGQIVNRTAVSDADYTVLVTDYIIAYTALTAQRTVTLNDALADEGRIFMFKDEAGGALNDNIVIDPEGATTIDGVATATLNTNYDNLTIYSDGQNWFTMFF